MARQQRIGLCCVALAVITTLAFSTHVSASEASLAPVPEDNDSAGQGSVCFIIRTYWGHGDTWGDKSLRRLLGSLVNQTVGRWEALLVVMDNRPFPELRRIVREFNDSRIWVHAEWINFKYNPKEGGVWAPTYHNKLYNLTDMAIRACPEHSKWVVVTNGDNLYDQAFVETVFAAPKDVDVVAIDFYSRYQRPTANPCERFEEGEGMPPCKENEMRFCQTDLAANAYRLARMLEEDRRFGLVDPSGTHGANDGIMAQHLKTAGWKIHYARGRCLIIHAPSPQQCALAGGVWDDTIMNQPSSFGGSCVSTKSVVDRMRAYPEMYELLELNVTFDRNSFSYSQHSYIELRCLRLSNRSMWYQVTTFGRVCASRVDIPDLPADLPAHPWDDWVPSPEDEAEMEIDGEVGAEGTENEEEWHPVEGGDEEEPATRDEL